MLPGKRLPAAELTNSERADKPPADAPSYPGVEPKPWHGSAVGQVLQAKAMADKWRAMAEYLTEQLQQAGTLIETLHAEVTALRAEKDGLVRRLGGKT